MRNQILTIFCCLNVLFLSEKLQAQCEGRYETEIFTTVTKTTVEYTDVYKDSKDTTHYLRMDIYQPDGDTFAKRPVVIMAHGGTFIGGDRNEATCVEVCQMLAKRGYVTASIDYRLASSQLELFDSINALKIALRAVGDMKAAVRYFRKDAATTNIYHTDPNQIFAGGNSAGAVTAVHVAYADKDSEIPSYLQPIIAQNGGINGDSGNPGYPSNVSGVINLAGGINKLEWIESGDVPMVSCHGDNDNTVPYNCGNVLYPFLNELVDLCGSGAMKTRCDQAGTDNILHTYPGDGHVPWESDGTKRTSMKQQVGDFMFTYTTCDTGTASSISEINARLNVALYPNPVENYLTIDVKDNSGNFTSVVYDYLGKELLRFDLNSKSPILNISSLKSGYYFLRIYTNKGEFANRTFTKI